MKTPFAKIVAIAAILLATTAVGSFAAEDSGNIFGTVTDTEGNDLPGVTVTLSNFGTTVQITNSGGQFRFLGLAPGSYALNATLDGFSTVEYPNISVNIGRNTTIEVELSSAVEEVITVTSESPLLDSRKISAGTTISQIEMEKIPSARDPWVVMTQAGGVILDRVNVGGNESGQQSSFVGAGTGQRQNTYYIDGAEVTDRAAAGSSPTYFDFDQFAEYELQTGGSDVSRDSAGVSVNLVTKRGSNELRGSARFFLTEDDGFFGGLGGGDEGVPAGDLGPNQTNFTATQVDRVEDFGLEAGGPVWKDKLWAWGSYGKNDIAQITAIGTSDRTILENSAAKLNAQFGSSNSAVGSFNNGDKRKFGRGAASNRDATSLWNQRGPTGITKFEDTHVVNSNFFLSGQYVKVDGGFSLAATGGCGASGLEYQVDANGIISGRQCGFSNRPSEEVKLDGSYFFNTGNTNHEIKFGGRVRDFEVNGLFAYPGRNIMHYDGSYQGVQTQSSLDLFGLPASRISDIHFVYAYRAGDAPTTVDYQSFWVQDTMTMDRWTVNFGFRWDVQDGANVAAAVDANGGFPSVMPGLSFGGDNGGGLEWDAITPRVGVTYALGEERKTLLRGSFARFADPLQTSQISRLNPVGGQFASIIFVDTPGGNSAFYDAGEDFRVTGGLFGFDPANPTALSSSNQNDAGMDPPLTDELILAVEHALLPEFVVGAQITARKLTDIPDLRELFRDSNGNIVTPGASSYVAGTPVTYSFPGDPTVNTFTPRFVNPALGLTSIGGALYTNGDREVDYLGATLNFTKRLSNQWMLRGYLNWGEGEWSVPGSYLAVNDPNPLQPTNQEGIASNASVDGALFVEQSTGGGKNDTWLQASWSYNVNGMYQVAPDRPWGFNVAGNLYGREGYPIPYFFNVTTGIDGIGRTISANEVGGNIERFRTDDLMIVDLRLEKEFAASGNTSLTFSIDGFNIFDEDAVVSRSSRNVNAGSAGNLNESLSPRIWRLGVRLNWR